MEINLERKANAIKDEVIEKVQVKCRHDNKGKFRHAATICDTFLMDGKCGEGHGCQNRHPRVCKYRDNDTRGCRRGEFCKYLHKKHQEIKGKPSNVEKEHENVGDIDDLEKEDEKMEHESPNAETDECVKNYLKVVEMKNVIAHKESTINELKETEEDLKKEIANLNAQIEKLKKIAFKMHCELESLKKLKWYRKYGSRSTAT